MKEIKTITKPKDKESKLNLLAEQEKLNLMIIKNPKIKTLIDKLDLVLINTSKS
jgi:hypothetical protein